ncbi:MAG: TetR/AcrR family transcriptional regulator [Pyrinomonadaceae bacterium]
MAIRERKQREKETLRREILDAARELFVSEGYENVSMRKIADRIEYSPTTIYLYFKDKTELLREICETTFLKLGYEIEKSQSAGGNPLEVLRNGMLSYIHFGLSNPHHYDLVFISPNDKNFNASEFTYENSMGKRAFELLVSSVAKCMSAGSIRTGDVALTAQTLWACIHGITSLLITHKGFPFHERRTLIESVVDTSINGLRR